MSKFKPGTIEKKFIINCICPPAGMKPTPAKEPIVEDVFLTTTTIMYFTHSVT